MVLSGLRLTADVAAALAGFRRGLEERFGSRLRELKLFGSRARGEARHDSDADVLVVLDHVDRADFVAVTDLCGDLLVQHDVIIDPQVIGADRIARDRAEERPLAMEIERDGVAL